MDSTAADVTAAQQAKDTADAAVTQANADLESARTQASKAAQDKAKAQQDLADAQAAVTAAQAAADAAKTKQQQGALGWFQSRNSTLAEKILTDSSLGKTNPETGKPYLDETHLGESTDATSLPNLIEGIKMVQEANKLRATQGLSPLKISDAAMAVAMVQANSAINKFGHNHQFDDNLSLAENLSYGWEGYNPYNGWWDKEKKTYDAAVASGQYGDLANTDPYTVMITYPDLYKKHRPLS